MASKAQITKNLADVHNAWWHFQNLVNSQLYGWAGNMYSYGSVFQRRR